MGADTKISWTDFTYNPWVGCTEVSPGCDNCYARELAERRGWAKWGAQEPRHLFKSTTARLLKLNRKAESTSERKKVFCMSLGDILDNEVDQSQRDELWNLIEQCNALDWQLLTKRIGNAEKMFPERWLRNELPAHVWLGITVVNQEEVDRDIPKLLRIPAGIRWLSVEPMLGPIKVRDPIDWVVCGGESGSKRRELDLCWLENIVAQCQVKNIPVWVKQDSAPRPDTQGRIFDAWWIREFPKDYEMRRFTFRLRI